MAGDEHGATFASAEVDEGVFGGGMGRVGGLPEVDQGAQDAGGYAVVGGYMLVVGVAGGEASGGDESAGFDSVGSVEGMDGRVDGVGFSGQAGGWHGLAELDEVGVAVQAKEAAASGGDVARDPAGGVEEGDVGVADDLEASEAVGDLSCELGFGGLFGGGEGEGESDAVFAGDAGDVGAGGFEVGGDGEGAEETEIHDVAGNGGVEAVAEGGENFCFRGLRCGRMLGCLLVW